MGFVSAYDERITGKGKKSMGFMYGTGMAKEHRIPLVRIRCMTDRRWKELRKVWQGQG
jgi:hypothetical protein